METRKVKIKDFNSFINENYLSEVFQRFYMLVRKPFPTDSENILGKMIGEARNALFDQISIDNSNFKYIPIQPGIPVLNFTEDNDLIENMLKENIIDQSSLYNQPEESRKVSDKVTFHHNFSDSKFIPQTFFSVKDAEKLNFPIIAKPAVGKSAEGIKKFDSYEELCSSTENFDIFSETINIKNEYRCFCFKDQIIELNIRVKVKGADDFLKDSSTKTDFIYQDIDLNTYKNLQKINEIIQDCKKRVSLDFFSIDFAETPEGDLFIIEMNSRTGMGVDKMVKLYTLIYEDFYNKELNDLSKEKLSNLEKAWEEAYEEEKTSGINECIVIGGKLEDKMFLFKNRDRSFTPESEIIREKLDNVEVVYYTDQTGWVEGMNEYGVGFVFSALTNREYLGYDPSYYMTDEPKSGGKFDKFRDGMMKILSSKNIDQAIERILKSKKSGSFIVSDKKKMVEIEIFKGKNVKKEVDFQDFAIKTNHGDLIPEAGHQSNGYAIKRASSTIRRHQAKMQLQGTKSISEIPSRMKFQAFDQISPLNTFRTDHEENTISQCMMNLTDGIFYFFHDNSTANSVKLTEKIKGGKITIKIQSV